MKMQSFHKKIVWYKNRLQAMSPPEIMHRTLEMARRHADKYRRIHPPKSTVTFQPLSFIPKKLDQAALTEEHIIAWLDLYNNYRDGHFNFLGKTWPHVEQPLRWHLDPITDRQWPSDKYSFDINYRHKNDYGDVKYVWELSRLQYLQPLAALAYIQKNNDIAQFCLAEIESWIDHNPPFKGIHWTSGIELALRAVSICFVLTLLGSRATPALHAKITDSLYAHGQWLARYPSKYSSANNHQTAEGLGLLILSLSYPHFPHSKQWQALGWAKLCASADNLILPDGVGAEQSPSYAAITLEMLMLGRSLAEEAGIDVPDSYQQKLNKGTEFLKWIIDEKGNYPHIGDDDNGCVIGLHSSDYILSLVHDELMHGKKHLRQIILDLNDTANLPESGVKLFPHGGYTVGRLNINDRHIMWVFDHGNLGFGSIAAHGHADALSLWLHVDGQPIFVDAGTYLYHSGGKTRDELRGTRSHNTLCVKHRNSSMIAGPFNWSHKAQCRVISSDLSLEKGFIEAEHNGYLKSFSALHRRRVEWNSYAGMSVCDSLVSSTHHDVEINYLLHPDISVVQSNEGITLMKIDRFYMRIRPNALLEFSLVEDGLYSPSFGIMQKTKRIKFHGRLQPTIPFQLDFSF